MFRPAVLLFVCTLCMFPQETADSYYKVIRSGDLNALRLLTSSSDVNTKDRRGSTPLMYAAAVGNLESMKILLDAGADAKVKNALDASPLHWCADNYEKVRLLVEKGADVNAVSKSMRTPLAIAAAYPGNLRTVSYLIEHGANVNFNGPPESIPLVSAVSTKDESIANLLLAKGADVHAAGDAALIFAASIGSVPITKALLAKGANANAASPKDMFQRVKNGRIMLGGFTPLVMGTAFGPPEIVQLLLDAGANVNTQDVRGMTPLMYAVARDHADPKVIKMLLDKGADKSLAMFTGETSIEWAKRYNDSRILPLFELTRQDIPKVLPASAGNPGSAREGALRALGLLQKTSSTFMNTGGCVACHAQPLVAMATKAAKANGIPVDSAFVEEQLKSARLQLSSFEQRFLQGLAQPGDPDSSEYQLFLLDSYDAPADRTTDATVSVLLSLRTAEGGWRGGGFSRSPMEHTDFSRTAMAIRVLTRYPIPARKAELDSIVQKGVAWLSENTAETNEERVMQILGLLWAGKPTSSVQKHAKALAALQRADGGWGQNEHLASDAYATGQTLYTLLQAGMKTTDATYRKGVAFLLKTQKADGSWHVASRSPKFQPYFQSGFPHDHDQWISMAGTAWATMALAYAPGDKPLRASR